MKLHSLILAAVLIPGAVSAIDGDAYDATLAFERGLSVGVDAVEREYKVQGWKQEVVEPLNFMVVLDSKNCSTKKTLLLKDFGFRRGLTPIELTNNFLYYKSFDNRPDAEELVNYLNNYEFKEISEKVYVYKKKTGEKFLKAPFAFKYIYDSMQKEIKEGVQVIVMSPEKAKSLGVFKEGTRVPAPITDQQAEITAPLPAIKEVKPVIMEVKPEPKEIKPVVKSAPMVKKEKTKVFAKAIVQKSKTSSCPFTIKGGQVEYFSYASKDGVSDYNLNGRAWEDKKFKVQKPIKNVNATFYTSGSVTSANGIKYVKVAGKNMYFDAYSTTLGE